MAFRRVVLPLCALALSWNGAAVPLTTASPAPPAPPATAAPAPLPNRPDPFLPLDFVWPREWELVPAEVIDFGLPFAQAGAEPERAAGEQPRVAALSWDHTGRVFAVLEFAGRMVTAQPGDEVQPGVRVAAMDVARATVILRGADGLTEVPLMPRAGASPPPGNSGGP